MSRRLVIRNSIFLTLAGMAEKFVFLFFFAYVARHLGSQDFGRYSFVLAVLTFLGIPLDLGFSNVFIREVARRRESAGQYLADVSSLKLVILLVELAVLSVAVPRLIQDALVARLIVWGFVGIGIANVANGFLFLYSAFEEMGFQSLLQTLGNLLSVVVGFIVLRRGAGLKQFFIWYAVIVLVFRALVIAVLSWIRNRRYLGARWHGLWRGWGGLLRVGFPFAVSNLMLIVCARTDSVLLYKLRGPAEVGIYNAALSLIMGLVFIPTAVANALYPNVAKRQTTEAAGTRHPIAETIISLMLLLGVPLAVVGTILAPMIIGRLFGPQYAAAAPVFAVLSWSLPCIFATYALGAVTAAHNLEVSVAKIYVIAAAFNVIANVAGIWLWGARGASAAMVATQFLILVLYRVFTGQVFVADAGALLRIALASAVMGGVIALLAPQAGLFWSLPAGIAVYFMMLAAIERSVDETRRLLSRTLFRLK